MIDLFLGKLILYLQSKLLQSHSVDMCPLLTLTCCTNTQKHMNERAGMFCPCISLRGVIQQQCTQVTAVWEPHDSLFIYSYSTFLSLFKISCHGWFQHALYFAVQINWQRYINTVELWDDLGSVVVWKWKIFNRRQAGDNIFGLFHRSKQYRTSSYHQGQFTTKDASWFSELWKKRWNLGKHGLSCPSVHKIVGQTHILTRWQLQVRGNKTTAFPQQWVQHMYFQHWLLFRAFFCKIF